jgi:hypothetical protein
VTEAELVADHPAKAHAMSRLDEGLTSSCAEHSPNAACSASQQPNVGVTGTRHEGRPASTSSASCSWKSTRRPPHRDLFVGELSLIRHLYLDAPLHVRDQLLYATTDLCRQSIANLSERVLYGTLPVLTQPPLQALDALCLTSPLLGRGVHLLPHASTGPLHGLRHVAERLGVSLYLGLRHAEATAQEALNDGVFKLKAAASGEVLTNGAEGEGATTRLLQLASKSLLLREELRLPPTSG